MKQLTAKQLLKEVRQLKKLASYSESELISAMVRDGVSKRNAKTLLEMLEEAIESAWDGAGARAFHNFMQGAKRHGLEESSSSVGMLNSHFQSQM